MVQLTAFAIKQTRGQRLDYAQDLAQDAITQFLERPETWVPETEPLLKHLAKKVIGLARNNWTRRRTAFEVLMANEDIEGASDADDARPDAISERRQYAAAFQTRLETRLAGDEAAGAVLQCLIDGVGSAADQSTATGLSIPTIREARRRIFYHAKQVTEELSLELDEENVAQ